MVADAQHVFKAQESDWGFASFMPLGDLYDPLKGYLKFDTCIIEAVVLVPTPNDSVTDSELTDEEEDMATFFEKLESEFTSSKTVSSKQVKEALAKVEEALDIAPAKFDDSVRVSSIQKALKVLLYCNYPSSFTFNQKAVLLDIQKRLKELPERAVKSIREKNSLNGKASIRLSLTQSLESSLTKYKEAKEETDGIGQEIGRLQEQVDSLISQIDEKQKKKEKMMEQQRETFGVCKKLKLELSVLERELSEYEAKMKAAEEEENTVATEWGRMKDFVSSLRKALN
ncbi:hypothetical protein PTKIN_Ptkin16aG0067200 [Pterospermum kingtungense]